MGADAYGESNYVKGVDPINGNSGSQSAEYWKTLDEDYSEDCGSIAYEGAILFGCLVLWLLIAGGLIALKWYGIITWHWFFVTLPITIPLLLIIILGIAFYLFVTIYE